MNSTIKLLALLAYGLGAALLVTGCVRLSEPDQFICNSNADCDSGEKCLATSCVSKTTCRDSGDCNEHERCANQQCVKNQCEYATAATDCHGQECEFGVCKLGCTHLSGCVSGFHCESNQCLAGDLLNDGQACSTDAACYSGKCCAKPSGSLCTTTCPAVPDDSCRTDLDCRSHYCCKQANGQSQCSDVPCSAVPECMSNADCGSGRVCFNQKCAEAPALKSVGESCNANSECQGQTCFGGVCRGYKGAGQPCTADAECETHRLCCANVYARESRTCGEVDRGCPGSLGDACELDLECLDKMCVGPYGGFCSKPCTTNADCGVSPWGVPNACETNGEGDMICFPGCTGNQECYDNLDTSFSCFDAFDSNAKICAAE